MKATRIAVAVVGFLLPYLVRIPGGRDWVGQYLDAGLPGLLYLSVFNFLPWGTILLFTCYYRYPVSVLFPALAGFGFLGYAHFTLDLAANQAALGLFWYPIYAFPIAAAGGVLGFAFDRLLIYAMES